ncbi:archease [Candidatus Woesearchaeota archaeon]|nr:MAG: archease [Candidatus Woesearchaeota archaeon]
MPYKILPHTADWMVEATGNTLEEAFAEAARGAFEVICPPDEVRKAQSFPIKVQAKRLMSLLYEFIEELIVLTDTEGFLLNSLSDMKIVQNEDGFTLTAIAWGDHYKNYDVKSAIKSMTYSDMLIKEEQGKYRVRITVDI